MRCRNCDAFLTVTLHSQYYKSKDEKNLTKKTGHINSNSEYKSEDIAQERTAAYKCSKITTRVQPMNTRLVMNTRQTTNSNQAMAQGGGEI